MGNLNHAIFVKDLDIKFFQKLEDQAILKKLKLFVIIVMDQENSFPTKIYVKIAMARKYCKKKKF
jgi:hypothetical protein